MVALMINLALGQIARIKAPCASTQIAFKCQNAVLRFTANLDAGKYDLYTAVYTHVFRADAACRALICR